MLCRLVNVLGCLPLLLKMDQLEQYRPLRWLNGTFNSRAIDSVRRLCFGCAVGKPSHSAVGWSVGVSREGGAGLSQSIDSQRPPLATNRLDADKTSMDLEARAIW